MSKEKKAREPIYLIFRNDGTSLVPLEKNPNILTIEKYLTDEAIRYSMEKEMEESKKDKKKA